MPWKLGKHVAGKGWEILRADTGEVKGYSDSKEKAMASIRARYAHMPMGEVAHKRVRAAMNDHDGDD